MSSTGLPFPQYLLNEIHQYPGNDRCCDCSSLDTDWASVSHGTLICLDCAGKHRSLGVNVSFVRSISMDTWSKRQLEMMRQGGNGQIKRFFRRLEVTSSNIHHLYNSREAEHYRQKLEERVDKICSGELKSHVRIFRNIRSASNDSFKTVEELSRITASNIYSVKFDLGPLGITMTKDYNGEAVISKVSAGSPAEKAGIMMGDYVKGVANIFSDKYDEIMKMITTSPRPFTVLLLRCSGQGPSGSPKSSPKLNKTPSMRWEKRVGSSSSCRNSQDELDDMINGRLITCESIDKDDLTEEDVKASSQEQLQGLELSVGSATIRQLNSFVLGRGSLAPDLSALNSNSTDLSSNPSMHIPAEESEENESPDDLDDWVEEESSAVNCHSASYAIDDLAIDETRSLNPPKQSVSKPSLPPRHTNTKTGFTLTVTFDQLPLGFTLSATHDAKAEVIRLREGGRAMQLGVNVNDVLIAIDNESIAHYHDAMERLTHTQLPVRLTFYRANFLRFHGELNGMVKSLTTSAKLEHDEHVFSSLKKNLSFSNVEGFS